MFDKMKALMDMKSKMQEIKRQLEMTVFEVESADRLVKLTMNGSQEVKAVKLPECLAEVKPETLEKSLKDAFSRALKRSQEEAAAKMKAVTGLSLPGM